MEKIKQFIQKINERGIPLPLLRINGVPTFTGTMTFICFNTCLLGQFIKVAKVLGEIDLTQANYLFLMCLGTYLGRRMQTSGKQIELEKDDNK